VGRKEGFITGDSSSFSEATKLEGRVFFTGYVTDKMLKQYMDYADALVFPSLYEGFGLPPLEAMATGCPVIASNIASLREIFGDAVFYFDPYRADDIAAKILELINNRTLLEFMRKKGLAHARKFDWDSCINETCKVIDSLLPTTVNTTETFN
jgi:glycosyltransferase involved in cell wall biosynthesis